MTELTPAIIARQAEDEITYPPYARGPERLEALMAYRVARERIELQFAENLSATYGTSNAEADASVFQSAWGAGRSSGYGKVEQLYKEIIEADETTREAGK